jgi:hypothetical protein
MKNFGSWLSQLKNTDSAIADLQQDFASECTFSGKKPSNFLSPFHLLNSVLAHDACTECVETLKRVGTLFFSEEPIVKTASNLFFVPITSDSWMSGEGLFFHALEKIMLIDKKSGKKGSAMAMRFHLITRHYSCCISNDRRWLDLDGEDSEWLYLNGLAFHGSSGYLDLYRIPRDSSLFKSPSPSIKQWSHKINPVEEHQVASQNYCLYSIDKDDFASGELPSLSFWQHFSFDDHIKWQMPTPVVYYLSAQRINRDIGFVELNTFRIEQLISKGLVFARSSGRKRKSLSVRTRRKVMERDGFKCVDCGRSPQNDSNCVLHVDHRKAVSEGGTNCMENLQTLCDWCNLGKKTDLDWKLKKAC